MDIGSWFGDIVRGFVIGDPGETGTPANLINRGASVAGSAVEKTVDSIAGFPSGIVGSSGAIFLEFIYEVSFMVMTVFDSLMAIFDKFSKVLVLIFEILITDLINLVETVLLYLFIFGVARTDIAIEVVKTFNNALVTTISSLTNVVSSGTNAIGSGASTLSNIGSTGLNAARDVTTTGVRTAGSLANTVAGGGMDMARDAGRGVGSAVTGAASEASKAIQRPGERKHELDTIKEQGTQAARVDEKRIDTDKDRFGKEFKDRGNEYKREIGRIREQGKQSLAPEKLRVGLEKNKLSREFDDKDNQHKRELERIEKQATVPEDMRKYELQRIEKEGESREKVARAQAEATKSGKRARIENIIGSAEEWEGKSRLEQSELMRKAMNEGYTEKEVTDYVRDIKLLKENSKARYGELRDQVKSRFANSTWEQKRDFLIGLVNKLHEANQIDNISRNNAIANLNYYYRSTQGVYNRSVNVSQTMMSKMGQMYDSVERIQTDSYLRNNYASESSNESKEVKDEILLNTVSRDRWMNYIKESVWMLANSKP